MLCLPARERDCRASLPHGAIDMCLAAGYLPSGTSKLSATELELLTRATCRCSASTAARVVGASSLGAAELRCMQSELHALQATLTHQGADSTTAEGAVRPPESGALSGSALHPNFGRLRELAPVDQLKGEDVEKPIVMPVELSLVPDEVHSLQDVSNALQHACYCCTLLSNQHGLVRDSFALRVGLITHLFLRVLPHPLPPGRSVVRQEGDALSLSCFWQRLGSRLSSDTQSALLRWLDILCRHFAAASLAVPLGRSFDAARMLVFAAIAALVDAVLRIKAHDAPTALSLHYGGHVTGTAGWFALDLRHLEDESAYGQLLQPRFAAARTMLLDYFHAWAMGTPSERHIFRWDLSMGFGASERAIIGQLALHLGFPRSEPVLRKYLSGENSGEWHAARAIERGSANMPRRLLLF